VAKGKTVKVSPSTVCIKTIWIVDVGVVLRNKLKFVENFTKKPRLVQNYVSAVKKYH
jgi:hypothetical protein